VPVAGQGRSPIAPPGVQGARGPSTRSSPPRRPPSQDCPASRSARPSDVAALLVRSSLPAVVTASRSSVARPASDRRPKRLPQAWAPLRAHHRVSRPRSPDRERPSWGSTPLRRHVLAGPLHPGDASPGTFRPRGFSPPRRFPPCSPRGHEGRCRPWGSYAVPRPLRTSGRGASLRRSRSIATGFPLLEL